MKTRSDINPRVLPNWPQVDPERRSAGVRRFFQQRAARYDQIARRPYWRFCGTLLERLLGETLLKTLDRDAPMRILDAGGGTGEWALRLLAWLPRAEAVLLDLSSSMLDKAVRKARRAGLAGRLSVGRADLHQPISPDLGSFDVVLCFHNVASLVADPNELIRNLTGVLKPGGSLALVVPNRYQASWICLRDGRFSELRRIREQSVVRYHVGFPDVLLFTPSVLRESLGAAGCGAVSIYGYPVSVPPVHADASLPLSLAQRSHRDRFLESEVQLCLEEEAAVRGHHFLVLAKAPKG